MIYTKTKEIPWCPKLRGSIDSIWFPVFGQVKMDGEYHVIKWPKDECIYAISKTGIKRSRFPDIDKLQTIMAAHPGVDLMAELYHGSGLNHSLHELLKDPKSDSLKLFIHDIVIQNITTAKRMELLSSIMGGAVGVVLNDREAVDRFFADAVARGYEGVVLKPMNSTLAMAAQWIKLKASDETIMTIIDLCGNDDRVGLNTGHGGVSAKISLKEKKHLKLGDQMLVKHFGFIGNSGGVRNPIIIKKVG